MKTLTFSLRSLPWLDNPWILLLILLSLCFCVFVLVRLILLVTVTQFFKYRHIKFHKKHERGVMIPFALTSSFMVMKLGLLSPFFTLEDKFEKIFHQIFQIGITLSSIWALFNLVDIVSIFFIEKAKKTEGKFDDILIPLLKTFAKITVLSLGIILIGHALGIDVKSLIAGLGIGGIALALAAKDTLSNFFGSIMLILDRPFQVDDWVRFDDGLEGTIESVGFRSTRIKTFYDSEISIPNSKLGNTCIDNYGRRKYRRFSTKVGIQYDTSPEKIEAFCEGIRNLILEQPHSRKDYFQVYLNELDQSSLNILVYVFWKVSDWSQELTERHRLLIDIIRLAQAMGVEFAFPTRTLHLFNEENQQESAPLPLDENFHESGQKLAKNIAKKRISPLRSRSSLHEAQAHPLKDD